MKKLYNIFLFATVVCAAITATSCSKEDSYDTTPQYVVMNMNFTTRANATTEQGDKIEDVNVWAYEIGKAADGSVTVANNGKPVGWGMKSYTGVYDATPASEPVRVELPYSTEDKTYRFLAVVNQAQFGKLYTPMSGQGTQSEVTSLPRDISYDNLISYVFQASDATMTTNPTSNTPEVMPVSHWMDIPADGGAKGEHNIDMTVYRTLAKATLNAKLSSASSQNANVKINSAQIKVKGSHAVPAQGFLFSSGEDVSNLEAPAMFGNLTDLKTGEYTPVTIASDKAVATTSSMIGSHFLYENVHGTAASAGNANTDNYNEGGYYMEINYSYGSNGTYDKTATGYVPLPAIVRNHEYQVNATFTINLQGVVTLTCTVADWVQDSTQGNAELSFDYPTYSVMAYERDSSNNEVFNAPTVTGTSTSFTMLFQMTGPTDGTTKWKPALTNAVDFNVEVYAVDSNYAITGSDLFNGTASFAASDAWYAVKVSPKNAQSTTARATDLSIVFNPKWLSNVNEAMLINGTITQTKWPNSGGNPHHITITQLAQ